MRSSSKSKFAAFVVILCVLAATAACSSSSSSTEDDNIADLTAASEPSAQETFLRANEALDAGDWKQAARLYQEVVDADPQRWEAHMNRGIALTRAAEFRQATESFARALESGGDQEPILYFNLGNHYQERGLYESAIDSYRTSMAVGGGLDYETLLNISASFTFLNAYGEARQTIDRAIELDPDDPRGHVTRGLIEYSDGNPDRALEIYGELKATNPDFAPLHYNRGYILLRLNRDSEATEAFETYLRLAPDGPYVTKTQSHLGTIERRQQR